MRRADRLFQIIQILRRKRLTRAAEIADELEISQRTVYRDVSDLAANGVPITGEAGVGYVLDPGFDLPPLQFTAEELEVLALAGELVENLGDAALTRTIKDALAKIAASRPQGRDWSPGDAGLLSPAAPFVTNDRVDLTIVRAAIRTRKKLALAYMSRDEARTQRKIWPLAVSFYGPVRLVSGWCELRQDFRSFRADLIEAMTVLDERYPPQRGRTLADFRKAMRARMTA
jgi:predicted DNA-binding transcriptional regulator YafY